MNIMEGVMLVWGALIVIGLIVLGIGVALAREASDE